MVIPVVVGVTGHRDLREEDLPRLRELAYAELKSIKDACPDSRPVILDSLAEGADMLCAEAALELGYSLVVPLPFALEEYRCDFRGAALERFDALLAQASHVFVAPDAEGRGTRDLAPSDFSAMRAAEAARDYGYRQAGLYVADHSQVLIAFWDGSPASEGGCGAAEVAEYMLCGRGALDARCARLVQIVTPRAGGSLPAGAFEVKRFEAGPVGSDEALKEMNDLNRAAALSAAEGIKETYTAADGLAGKAQKGFFKTVLWLAVLCAMLVFAFLAYDELESDIFLPVYAAALIAAWVLLRREGKLFFHRDFLRFRALAESLRTQEYLLRCGISDVNVCDFYTWTQRFELGWLREAVSALTVSGRAASGSGDFDPAAAAGWAEEQLRYHCRAAKRKRVQNTRNERLCSALAFVSVALFAAVFAFEYLAPAVMESSVAAAPLMQRLLLMRVSSIPLRGLFKIALGVVSTLTLFLSSYYGRLSLDRQIEDHEKMAVLYERAANAPVIDRGLCISLAREELIENGNWLSYMKENKPGIDL